jgi:cobalamin biosynthesis Co2+ chelatase CbiK
MASRKGSKQVKKLALLAYERDLSRCIEKLQDQMAEWKNDKISVWDVEQSIHEFHDKIARSLYRSYALTDPITAVAFGVAQAVITLDDVPEDVRQQIQEIAKVINRE